MDLLSSLRTDLEGFAKIAESDLPSVTEVQGILGALIRRIETQAVSDGQALLAGDPDPVIDPATVTTQAALGGGVVPASAAVLPTVATVADPTDPAAPALPTTATADGGPVLDHTNPFAFAVSTPPITDVEADVEDIKGKLETLISTVSSLVTGHKPSPPTVTTVDEPVDVTDLPAPSPLDPTSPSPGGFTTPTSS
jgi:hypothetical protein